jgi:hypothetical protein
MKNMIGQRPLRHLVPTLVVVLAFTSAILGADIATEGFEPPGSVLGPLAQQNGGSGWSGGWNASGNNVKVEVVGTAPAEGSQHVHIYGTDSATESRYFITTSMVIYYSFEIQILNGLIANDFNIYLCNQNSTRVHMELRSNKDIRVRGSGDPVVGKWDGTDPRGLPNAGTQYVQLEILADRNTKTFDLWYGGTYLGDYGWRDTTDNILDHVKFYAGKSGSADPLVGGVFLDDILLAENKPGGMTVFPVPTAYSAADEGHEADPNQIGYTITNGVPAERTYTIQEVEAENSDAVTDYDWLSVDPAQVVIPAGQSNTVAANIDTTTLRGEPPKPKPPGTYTGWLKFSDGAGNDAWREIVVTIRDWEVTPTLDQFRTYHHADYPAAQPAPVVYTVTNTSNFDSLTYTVAETDADGYPLPDPGYTWLSLDRDTTGTTLGPGNSDTVTASIDTSGLTPETYVAYLKFAQGAFEETRRINLTVTASGFVQIVEYVGDVDPTAADSGGPGITFAARAGVLQGSLVTSGPVADGSGNGSVWYIQDSSSAKTKLSSVPATEIHPRVGATALARVKVLSPSSGSDWQLNSTVLIVDGELTVGGLYGGTDKYVRETRRSKQVALPAGDADWHIMRLTAIGTNDANRVVTIYLDENPEPALQIVGADARDEGEFWGDCFGFGTGSTAGMMEIAFDWVTGTNAGAFPPGAEQAVLGRSLIPQFCPLPFADADEDGDVDQADFAMFQLCYTGAGDPGNLFDRKECKCFDRDNDSDIDGLDVSAFEDCATGPGIPFDAQNPPPGCIP